MSKQKKVFTVYGKIHEVQEIEEGSDEGNKWISLTFILREGYLNQYGYISKLKWINNISFKILGNSEILKFQKFTKKYKRIQSTIYPTVKIDFVLYSKKYKNKYFQNIIAVDWKSMPKNKEEAAQARESAEAEAERQASDYYPPRKPAWERDIDYSGEQFYWDLNTGNYD